MRLPTPLARTSALLAASIFTMLVPARVSAQASAAASALEPGDVVRITVWRKPELSGEFRIMTDGGIGHPLYQTVNVRGVALPALTARLREFLATYEQNPQVVVEPLLRVAVGGEVRLPNLYTLPVGTTISQAVAQAGGAAENGNLSRVRLIRGGRAQMLDLADPGATETAMVVQSGDQLIIGKRSNVFRDVIGPFASILGAAAAIVGATR